MVRRCREIKMVNRLKVVNHNTRDQNKQMRTAVDGTETKKENIVLRIWKIRIFRQSGSIL